MRLHGLDASRPVTRRITKPYEGVGSMEHEWNNPPAPFNPEFDALAKHRYEAVTMSMEADDYYATHTREECAAEWGRRYEAMRIVDRAKKDPTNG